MLVLTLRTDNPQAEIGLFEGGKEIKYVKWQAHRELSETIHKTIGGVLGEAGRGLAELDGIGVLQGPGSFTGLRIGISVANALAYSLGIPIVSAKGGEWIHDTLSKLEQGDNEKIVKPFYGADPHITKPKK